MRIFSVLGISKSGKTTTIERIISELRKRKYTVGSVKEIHNTQFRLDSEGTNTDRHKQAGSQLVTARGLNETSILYQRMMPMDDILKAYDHDFVILEGVSDLNVPRIVTAYTETGIEKMMEDRVFAISGVISNKVNSFKEIPVINAEKEIERLVDLIEEKVFDQLPDFPVDCCNACGMSCSQFCAEILKGNAHRKDCILEKDRVKLEIDGNSIKMVPFVQQILDNNIRAILSELNGYRKNGKIEIKIG